MFCRKLVSVFLLSLATGHSLCGGTTQSPEGQTTAEPPFFATSFDCSKAKVNSTEEAICKNEELAKLDIETAAAYRKRLGTVPAGKRAAVIESQKLWLSVRNSCDMNAYYGDPIGMLSDLANFYRARFSVLRSSSVAELKTKLPGEYEWLKASAPQGFNSGFVIGRAYMTCHDPCRTSPSVYRMISVRGRGIGDEPGDIDTPFSQIEKVLTGQGWTKCRSADDSGKPTIYYFIKRDKMIRVFRYYSMGAGNNIEFGITTSGPLPRRSANLKQNPITSVPNDWATYSSPDVGLRFRYPPKWRLADNSILGPGAKYLAFGSNDFTGSFKITLVTEHSITHQPLRIDSGRPAPTCAPSVYKISGFAARTCFFEGENVADGLCTRDIEFLDVETGRYHLSFEPGL